MDTAIKRAEARLEHLSSDDETLALYEARQNARIEYNSAISQAKREASEEVARNLLALGVSINIIVQSTGLTVNEVEGLKEKHEQ